MGTPWRIAPTAPRARRAVTGFLSAFCLIGLGVALLAVPADGASLPPNAVAAVGGQLVTKADFDYWRRIAARGERVDPPAYSRCIASERRRARRRGRHPTRAALKAKCARRYAATKNEVIEFLVEALWVRQEAAAKGVSVSRAQIRRAFDRQKREAFPNRGEYRRFLRSSGQKEADVLFRVELDLLQTRLTLAAAKAVAPVTSADISRYYANHRRRFRHLSRRRARKVIRRLLRARREQRAVDRFVEDFRLRSKAKTVCGRGYVIAACGSTAERTAG